VTNVLYELGQSSYWSCGDPQSMVAVTLMGSSLCRLSRSSLVLLGGSALEVGRAGCGRALGSQVE
jgi:hypothetical protein